MKDSGHNAPLPGAGYRNLRRGELVQRGDERWDHEEEKWKPAALIGIPIIFNLGEVYRRKGK